MKFETRRCDLDLEKGDNKLIFREISVFVSETSYRFCFLAYFLGCIFFIRKEQSREHPWSDKPRL